MLHLVGTHQLQSDSKIDDDLMLNVQQCDRF